MKYGYPEPEDLNTGDNEKLHFDLTSNVLKELCSEEYKTVEAVRDRIGIFCHVMRAPDGSRVFLLVKGSVMWKGLISCQAFLPQRAATEHAAILVAMLQTPKAEAEYFLFNPAEIISKNEGYNERLGVKFVNFSVAFGERFYPNRQSVRRQLVKLQKRGFQGTL